MAQKKGLKKVFESGCFKKKEGRKRAKSNMSKNWV